MANEAAELQQRAFEMAEAVATALPLIRQSGGISQSMMASAMHVSPPYISKIETRGSLRTPAQVLNVATALGRCHDARDDLARARQGGKT